MKNVQKIDLGLTGYDELFANDEERKVNKLPRIFDIPISEIDDFPDHPFKVKIDEDMDQLVQSIKERGIITPVTLRPKEDGRYEIVSGHRRKKACELAGLDTVKAEVREMSRDEAIILMVESNLQRSTILPSEKAFSYKMRLEAMNRQGQRTDLTSTPVVSKSRSNEELGSQHGESREQVRRYDKAQVASRAVADAIFRKNNPTVREYCEKWLKMKSATVRPNTLEGYRKAMEKHIIEPIGDRYIDEITADDLKMLMVPVSKMSKGLYGTVNMLLKCVFYSAVESDVIRDNPAACINPRGGKAKKEKVALTDKQISTLLDTIKDLPPYLFVMLGLYAGLRREEILGLQWDCVHIDEEIPYISVRRAWRSVKNRPEVTTLLKTPAARRDIPIPQLLVDCLKAEKEKSSSDYVISDSNGEPLSYSQFSRVWHYITVRTVKERKIYRYINGEKIHHTISPKLGERCRTDKSIYYTLDFDVTPHLLRHTYITNLIHEGVDPKTVQYLAGHENSKVTMDIYAKVKYNKPWELATVVNEAFQPTNDIEENPAS